MKKLLVIIVGAGVLAMTGCASQAKYEAWSTVEAAKHQTKSEQAKALAQVASNSKDPTLAAFAVFSMAQLKDSGNSTPMPQDDALEYLRILAPIAGNLGLKAIDSQLSFKLAKEESYKYGLTMNALTKTPKTVSPVVVNPVVVEVPVPVE